MRVLIIAHPVAGINREKKEIVDKISAHISKNKGSVDIAYTMKPGIAKMYSARAALEGYDAVYAAGGDGTVNDVATGLIGRSTPMGIIPLGTGNGFARGLGIPFEAENLIEMFSKNRITQVDVGKISSTYFMATAGVGYDAAIAREFNLQQKNIRKLRIYFYIAIKNYFMKSSENLTLVVDGEEIKRKVFALTIANVSQYGGGAIIAPQAEPQSGSLIAVLIPKFNIFRAIPTAIKLFKGTVGEIKDIEYIQFKTLKIKREKAGYYHADGETFKGNENLNVSVIPRALRIIAP